MKPQFGDDYVSSIIEQAAAISKSFHLSDTTGHDWWHVYRVWNMAKYIAIQEKANLLEVELAALLHDMDDHKIEGADWQNFPNAHKALQNLKVDSDIVERVIKIISEVSFKGANVDTLPTSLDACVVQDADRLDALGAIGIARAFAYGGSKKHSLFNPEEKPQLHSTFEEYKNSKGSTLNHFHEKLFLLKDRINTNTAKAIAEEWHNYMVEFVERFLDEWKLSGF